MRIRDAVRAASGAFQAAIQGRYEESARVGIRGDVFLELRNAFTGAIEHSWERHNLVVRDASILIARLVKDNQESPKGAFALALGSGDSGWNPLNPPAPTDTQRALYAEISRKTFSSTQFVSSSGVPVNFPTNVVDFTTTFAEAEAVGPLVEMGILGGNIATNLSVRNSVAPANGPYDSSLNLTNFETLLNYLTFPVISKPATSTLGITWRLTF